ncbi:aminoglycoside phosphotransferase family protein [Bacillus sp. FJAT-27445]|uniref:aminoglycoside phosphotransferase family protein n=1 Tax=Bacillus sp. FJAT-27445 TaxID=1679166 RepID=UPI0009E90759|nr:aminoglycoside phosphotransferase family protein [Bacillus sp. FJAT-27445]
MKARIRGNRPQGDDELINRLLSYLKKSFPATILELEQIRPAVFYIRSTMGEFIVKGYSSLNRLILQENFTAILKKHGFRDSYSFMRPGKREPFYADGLYFGYIQYIPHHPKHFSFSNGDDRAGGLMVLKKFHSVTEEIAESYQLTIPLAKQIEKWKDRLNRFSANESVIKPYLGTKLFEEIINWADFGLKGMKKNAGIFSNGPKVVLHGDVAHHNFLRALNGRIYLIDFDLLSIGPPVLDYLQYANRILPFIQWSLGKLIAFNQFAALMRNEAFLYALIYPTDILREWNRLVKVGDPLDFRMLSQVKDLTLHQFNARRKFIKTIKSMIDST